MGPCCFLGEGLAMMAWIHAPGWASQRAFEGCLNLPWQVKKLPLPNFGQFGSRFGFLMFLLFFFSDYIKDYALGLALFFINAPNCNGETFKLQYAFWGSCNSGTNEQGNQAIIFNNFMSICWSIWYDSMRTYIMFLYTYILVTYSQTRLYAHFYVPYMQILIHLYIFIYIDATCNLCPFAITFQFWQASLTPQLELILRFRVHIVTSPSTFVQPGNQWC